MKQWLLTVQQRDDTRWHVCEIGRPRSLASFGLKDDAVEYARQLLDSWKADNEGADDNEGVGDDEFGEGAGCQAVARIGAHA